MFTRGQPILDRLDFFDQTSPEASDIYLQHIVFAANEASEAVTRPKLGFYIYIYINKGINEQINQYIRCIYI